jgi:hypothetical protein
MSDEPTVDLEFLAEQMRRLMVKVDTLADDMRVLTAIVMRQDGTQAATLEEIRAVHAQQSRMSNRLRELEDRQ